MKEKNQITTTDKLGEIKAQLKKFKSNIYTNADEGYDYLKNGFCCLEVKNPTGGDDLYIDLEKGFSLACGEWEGHYEATEDDYAKMMRYIDRFVKNELYLAVVYMSEEWICSFTVANSRVDKAPLVKQMKDFLHSADADEFIRMIKKEGAVITCTFWNRDRNREVKIAKGTLA